MNKFLNKQGWGLRIEILTALDESEEEKQAQVKQFTSIVRASRKEGKTIKRVRTVAQGVFEAAKKYDFDTIKNYIDSGGDINVCDDRGNSVLTCFIDAYLSKEVAVETEYKKDIFEEHDEYDYEFWDEYVYDFQITPLEKRTRNIHRELDYLFANNVDPNLCELVGGMAETPLYYSVCVYQDYYITKYLLEHGANPGVWLFDEIERMGADQEYFLIDDLDISIMNGDKGKKAENVATIAQLLWESGLKNWSGHCIDVDPEKGIIDYHPLRVKF